MVGYGAMMILAFLHLNSLEWVGYILVSWLLADFIAGVFHMLEDVYLDENTPFLGKLVGGPNKAHHTDPMGFLKGNYWHRNYTTIIPALIAALIAYIYYPPLVLTFLFVSQANEIHGWSHQKCNFLIRAIQETGFLASPRHHLGHHESPYQIRYCVMSNFLNPFLDLVYFWDFWKNVIYLFFGIKPLEVK
jgi:ubiquitin-conjugating enzyme E2 variant